MTPTPPSTTSSQSGHSPDANFRVVRKRNRVPLSCAPCRHRKLKCNRAHPCDNCTKRGDSSSCTYAAPAARKKGSQGHGSLPNGSPDDMQNRIDRLEGLVLSLMTNGSQAAGLAAAGQVLSAGDSSMSSGSLGPSLDLDLEESQMIDEEDGQGEESETEKVTKSFGIMKVDNEQKKTLYIGEAHWAALLNDIAEVRNYFSTHRQLYEAQMEKVAQSRKDGKESAGPALLFGAGKPPSRAEILSQLPSKYMTDILIARYFNTFDPAIHILHGPTFQKHYNQHWVDPSKSTIVWIGMLFAMMRIAMLSYSREGDEPPEFHGKCADLAATYRTQMAHCLISADYTKPHNHIIETLIFHLHGEYTSNRDAEASVWVLVGMIARMAMRMGYHRDSRNFPNITPYEGEMRRRIWTFVRQSDLLFSFQIALPSMIRIGDSDTDLPRNIYDDEFDEDSVSLPLARPASEATPVSYMIAKGRLAFGFGRVLEEINGVEGKGYDEIMKIDRGLRDIYSTIPEHLRLRPMADQLLAPVSLIMARFNLASVYHKAQCVLHRRFLRTAKTNMRYAESRRTCLKSAATLLNFQNIQHQEAGEKGRLRNLKRYVNSITTHDYLLAATILCMDVHEAGDYGYSNVDTRIYGGSGSGRERSNSVDEAYGLGPEIRKEDLVKLLEQSRDIWREMRDESMEAFKASEVIDLLLTHIRKPPTENNQELERMDHTSNGDEPSNLLDEKRNAAMVLGLLSSGGVSPNPYGSNTGQQQSQRGLGAIFENRGPNDVFSQNNLDPQFGGVFGATSTAALPSPGFSGFATGPAGDFGSGMPQLDWEIWDSYMQPSNLGLDPATALWSSNSSSTNPFSTVSSPAKNENVSSLTPNYYSPQSIAGSAGNSNGRVDMPPSQPQGPSLSANTTTSSRDGYGKNGGNAGEVFMGVPSPQPGGVPTWKWNSINDSR